MAVSYVHAHTYIYANHMNILTRVSSKKGKQTFCRLAFYGHLVLWSHCMILYCRQKKVPGTLLQCLCSYRFLYCNLLYVFSLMCCITGFFITTYFMFFHLRVVLHVSLLQPTLCFFTSVLCYRFLYYNLCFCFAFYLHVVYKLQAIKKWTQNRFNSKRNSESSPWILRG